MADDVVEHPGRREQQPPGERERAARRARAPARALVAHGELRRRRRRAPAPGARSRPRARRAPSAGTSARAPPRRRRGRVRAARARRRSSRRSRAPPSTRRSADCLAAVPRDARPRESERLGLLARQRTLEPRRERLERVVDRARRPRARGTTSSGPTPGTSTSRRRRARDERRSRTFTAPLRSSTVRSPSTPGRLCAVHVEQITEPLAYHGEGPCWLAASGEVAWVDMLAGRILATSLASGTTRVIDVPGPVAAIVRPRAARRSRRGRRDGRRGCSTRHDAPTLLCEVEHGAERAPERGRVRRAGALLVREHALRVHPRGRDALPRRGRRQRRGGARRT